MQYFNQIKCYNVHFSRSVNILVSKLPCFANLSGCHSYCGGKYENRSLRLLLHPQNYIRQHFLVYFFQWGEFYVDSSDPSTFPTNDISKLANGLSDILMYLITCLTLHTIQEDILLGHLRRHTEKRFLLSSRIDAHRRRRVEEREPEIVAECPHSQK